MFCYGKARTAGCVSKSAFVHKPAFATLQGVTSLGLGIVGVLVSRIGLQNLNLLHRQGTLSFCQYTGLIIQHHYIYIQHPNTRYSRKLTQLGKDRV